MSKKKSVFVSILTVSSLGIIAKVLGLLREGVVAAYFGTSAQMDVFSMLSSIMTTIITIFAASASITYLPIFIKDNEQDGLEKASIRLSNVLNQYIVYSGAFYVLLFFLAPLMPKILGDSVSGVEPDVVILYTRLLFWTIIASGFSRIQLSALSGLKDYGWLQKTTALYSLISMVLTLLFGHKYGVGVLVASYIVNSIIQLVILQYVLRKHGCKYSFYINFKDKDISMVWKTIFPVFLGTEVYMFGLTIDRTIGLSLNTEGIVSAFNYSGILYGLINTIIASPIITVFYTELSQRFFSGNIEEFYKSLSNTITLLVIVMVPIALFLCLDSYEFVYCALRRGAFDDRSVSMTSTIFAVYVMISPIYAFRILLSRIFLIMDDRINPMYSGCIFLIINVVFGYVCSLLWGSFGICLGSMVAMISSAGYLLYKLKTRYQYNNKLISTSAQKATISALASLAIVLTVKKLLPALSIYISFCLHALVFLIIYVVCVRLLKVPEYIAIETKIMRKLGKLNN